MIPLEVMTYTRYFLGSRALYGTEGLTMLFAWRMACL